MPIRRFNSAEIEKVTKGYKPYKASNVICIYIRNAKLEIVPPPFDDIPKCATNAAEKLIKTWPGDLEKAASRIDGRGGIFEGLLKRHMFAVSLDKEKLTQALIKAFELQGNHKMTTNEMALM